MTRKIWYLTSSRLALAAVFAAGVAAAPVAFNSDTITLPKAFAQSSGGSGGSDSGGSSGADGSADNGSGDAAAGTAGGNAGTNAEGAAAGDGDGAAQDFVGENDPTPDVGGSGSPGVGTGEQRFDLSTIDTSAPEFQRYKSAAERGDLDEAAAALSESPLADQALTPEMVEQVNEDLEVRSSLSPQQISERVNEDLPY